MDKHAFFGQNAENPPIFVQNHAKIISLGVALALINEQMIK
jgi:hypothetical protein